MKNVKMGEMTVKDLREYLKANRTIILPYGVVEQHGYHLPLDTDIRNAEVMGEKIARKLGCIVAPTLNYCFSGGMLEGTINVKPNTFSNLVGEIIESLVLQGFENIIIIPGHGGSESLFHLKESLRILKWLNPALKDTLILMAPLWEFSETWTSLFRSQDYHAGNAETSLIKHWAPDAVRDEVILDEEEIAKMLRDDPDSYQERTSFTGLSQEIVHTVQRESVKVGVMGFPKNACVETGKKITDEILQDIVPALKAAIATAGKCRKSGKRIQSTDNEKLKIMSL
ncbi:MAG: creatininase family protein [Victivallales bacterium]